MKYPEVSIVEQILLAIIPTGLTFEGQYKARLSNLDTEIGGSSKYILQFFCANFQLFRASGTPYHRGTQRLFSENICSNKQTLPRIFFCLRTAKNFQMNVPFTCTIFEAYLINSLRFSEGCFFIFYYPGHTIFLRKRKPKTF